MAIPKVVWKGNLYESYGEIQEEAIINQDLKIKFDKKAEELSLTGHNYIIYIDLFGNIEKVHKM